MIKVKPKSATYLGVPVTIHEVRAAASPTSERVIVTYWHADGTGANAQFHAGDLVMKHVKGDGRKPDSFQVFDEQIWGGYQADDAAPIVARYAGAVALGSK